MVGTLAGGSWRSAEAWNIRSRVGCGVSSPLARLSLVAGSCVVGVGPRPGREATGFCEDLGSLGGVSGKGVSVFVEGVAVVPADPFPLEIGVFEKGGDLLDRVIVLDPLTPRCLEAALTPPRTARCRLTPPTTPESNHNPTPKPPPAHQLPNETVVLCPFATMTPNPETPPSGGCHTIPVPFSHTGTPRRETWPPVCRSASTRTETSK